MAKPTRHGRQIPRYQNVPHYVSTEGPIASDLVKMTGRSLMPWQDNIMNGALGRLPDGRWSAPKVLAAVGRQNGKGDILIARMLYGMFVLGEKKIVYSAHETKTANDQFQRMLEFLEEAPELNARVVKVDHSKGEEGIWYRTRDGKMPGRLRYLTRTKAAGRGFGSQCLILDEAYALTDEQMAAIAPTMIAQDDPQIWFTSSHGMVYSEVLGRLVKVGREKSDDRLASFDWAPEQLRAEDIDANDRDVWYDTNPSLGHIMREEALADLRSLLGDAEFIRECLGIGQYPEPEGGWEIISRPLWDACADPDARIDGGIAFGVDVAMDRSRATVSASGRTAAGNLCIEVIDSREGTSWLPERLAELRDKWKPVGVFIDSRSPAASLELTVDDVTSLGSADVAKACSSWEDESLSGSLRHRDDPRLNTAVAKAKKRPYGDGAWFLGRKDSKADITPLTSATLALFGIQDHKDQGTPWIW